MTPDQQTAIEATIASAGSKATYAGASASILSWVLSSEFGILVGLCLGIGGFLINWYYKAKQDRREQAEHELRMQELTEQQHHEYQSQQVGSGITDVKRSGSRGNSPQRVVHRQGHSARPRR